MTSGPYSDNRMLDIAKIAEQSERYEDMAKVCQISWD